MDVYENLEEYNANRKYNVLIILDDAIETNWYFKVSKSKFTR